MSVKETLCQRYIPNWFHSLGGQQRISAKCTTAFFLNLAEFQQGFSSELPKELNILAGKVLAEKNADFVAPSFSFGVRLGGVTGRYRSTMRRSILQALRRLPLLLHSVPHPLSATPPRSICSGYAPPAAMHLQQQPLAIPDTRTFSGDSRHNTTQR